MKRLPLTRDEIMTISCALCRSVLTYTDDGFPILAEDTRIVRDKLAVIVDWMVEEDIKEIYIV